MRLNKVKKDVLMKSQAYKRERMAQIKSGNSQKRQGRNDFVLNFIKSPQYKCIHIGRI